MSRRLVVAVFVAACLGCAAEAAPAAPFTPGAPGIGDPYFPLDGNGGYDVRHYDLNVAYKPSTDRLLGVARINAKATQNLSRFNLDLHGLTVRSIRVDGRRARWSRDGDELTVKPWGGLRKGKRFNTVIRYDGVPETVGSPILGDTSGFIHTDDGAVVAGQPDVAATWFPVNDHPLDKASYSFRVTAPKGLEVLSNGVLKRKRNHRRTTTWSWEAKEPMASYLATATIGQFDVHAYRAAGIRYWDAIDPDLFNGPAPRTGNQFAISQFASLTYKRLMRTVDVPAGGGQLSFWVTRDTEPNWDFMFVEAHTVGADDWTTLPELNGRTSPDTGFVCPLSIALHPFLSHYQSDNGDGTCSPSGTSGTWSAATGVSDGYEQWTVDLAPYAGTQIELSISYASDDLVQYPGVFVDDITLPGGVGSTSFEDDGDTFDGWTVPGSPAGSEPNANDWIAGTEDDTPPNTGERADAALAQQPQIIDFLAGFFGPYPFSAAGGIVDDVDDLGFALENQTRPIYSKEFFKGSIGNDERVVVHELAHQWVGDSLALAGWQHIWLNEGFATYTEWLWNESKGGAGPQDYFDFYGAVIPADDPFWSVKIGDPGPDALFDIAVYDRGAMTLQALRLQIGDDAFFRLLRRWVRSNTGGNVTIPQFIALAERISGQQLDDLFNEWLFTAAKPASLGVAALNKSARSNKIGRLGAQEVPHRKR